MPSPQQPMAALESLRTVEFRQTLRGYHIDDVDEYLERVAVESDALQEQLRQCNERVRQASERIAQLEQGGRDVQSTAASAGDSLQRTLALAQKFVEQTEAESQAQARTVVEEAQRRARTLVSEAEERAKALAEESEKKLREEVTRLEGLRGKLAGDVDAISRHMDTERTRLRGALGEMLHWIDEHLQPSATLKPPAAAADAPRQRDEVTAGAASGSSPRSALQTLGPGNTPNGR